MKDLYIFLKRVACGAERFAASGSIDPREVVMMDPEVSPLFVHPDMNISDFIPLDFKGAVIQEELTKFLALLQQHPPVVFVGADYCSDLMNVIEPLLTGNDELTVYGRVIRICQKDLTFTVAFPNLPESVTVARRYKAPDCPSLEAQLAWAQTSAKITLSPELHTQIVAYFRLHPTHSFEPTPLGLCIVLQQMVVEGVWDRRAGGLTAYDAAKALRSLNQGTRDNPKKHSGVKAEIGSHFQVTFPARLDSHPYLEDVIRTHAFGMGTDLDGGISGLILEFQSAINDRQTISDLCDKLGINGERKREVEAYCADPVSHLFIGVNARQERQQLRLKLRLKYQRAVSVVGPSGLGKTELALALDGGNHHYVLCGPQFGPATLFGTQVVGEDGLVTSQGLLFDYSRECVSAQMEGRLPRLMIFDEATLNEHWDALRDILVSGELQLNGERCQFPGARFILLGNEKKEGYSGRFDLSSDLAAVPRVKRLKFSEDFLKEVIIRPLLAPRFQDPVMQQQLSHAIFECFEKVHSCGISPDVMGVREAREVAAYLVASKVEVQDAAAYIWVHVLQMLDAIVPQPQLSLVYQEAKAVLRKDLAEAAYTRFTQFVEALPQNAAEVIDRRREAHASGVVGFKSGVLVLGASVPEDVILVDSEDTLHRVVKEMKEKTRESEVRLYIPNGFSCALFEAKINSIMTDPNYPFVVVYASPGFASRAITSRFWTIGNCSNLLLCHQAHNVSLRAPVTHLGPEPDLSHPEPVAASVQLPPATRQAPDALVSIMGPAVIEEPQVVHTMRTATLTVTPTVDGGSAMAHFEGTGTASFKQIEVDNVTILDPSRSPTVVFYKVVNGKADPPLDHRLVTLSCEPHQPEKPLGKPVPLSEADSSRPILSCTLKPERATNEWMICPTLPGKCTVVGCDNPAVLFAQNQYGQLYFNSPTEAPITVEAQYTEPLTPDSCPVGSIVGRTEVVVPPVGSPLAIEVPRVLSELRIGPDTDGLVALKAIQDFLNRFSAKPLSEPVPTDSDQILVEIMKRQIGVCRHLTAVARMLLMALGIDYVLARNKTHMFLKIPVTLPNQERAYVYLETGSLEDYLPVKRLQPDALARPKSFFIDQVECPLYPCFQTVSQSRSEGYPFGSLLQEVDAVELNPSWKEIHTATLAASEPGKKMVCPTIVGSRSFLVNPTPPGVRFYQDSLGQFYFVSETTDPFSVHFQSSPCLDAFSKLPADCVVDRVPTKDLDPTSRASMILNRLFITPDTPPMEALRRIQIYLKSIGGTNVFQTVLKIGEELLASIGVPYVVGQNSTLCNLKIPINQERDFVYIYHSFDRDDIAGPVRTLLLFDENPMIPLPPLRDLPDDFQKLLSCQEGPATRPQRHVIGHTSVRTGNEIVFFRTGSVSLYSRDVMNPAPRLNDAMRFGFKVYWRYSDDIPWDESPDLTHCVYDRLVDTITQSTDPLARLRALFALSFYPEDVQREIFTQLSPWLTTLFGNPSKEPAVVQAKQDVFNAIAVVRPALSMLPPGFALLRAMNGTNFPDLFDLMRCILTKDSFQNSTTTWTIWQSNVELWGVEKIATFDNRPDIIEVMLSARLPDGPPAIWSNLICSNDYTVIIKKFLNDPEALARILLIKNQEGVSSVFRSAFSEPMIRKIVAALGKNEGLLQKVLGETDRNGTTVGTLWASFQA